ncbi:MAG TPA: CocE/NonD family hydrolase [Nitriliruptorales bacterium]
MSKGRLSLAILCATMLVSGPLVGTASAHGPYSVTADTTSQDATVTGTDGTTFSVRLLKPTATAPQGGWPVIIWRTGQGSSRCSEDDFITRSQLASYGYVVVSMTARGWPSKANSTHCGASDQASAIADMMNDSGNDLYGPNDIQDTKDVLSWALNQADTDDGNVGFFGHSHDGGLAYHLALADSRIDAVFAGAGLSYFLKGDNIADVSNYPNAPLTGMLAANFVDPDIGLDRHHDPSVYDNLSAWWSARFLDTTPTTANETWMNDRTFVDDDSAVDQGPYLTTPIFISHGFLDDSSVSVEHGIQAWEHLTNNNDKYLYLGACNSHGNPCGSGNASWLADKVHDFFDKYLKGASVTMGGPIFYLPPPTGTTWSGSAWSSSSDWGDPGESSIWPPNWTGYSVPYKIALYLRDSGILSDTAPTTDETDDTIDSPNVDSQLTSLCQSETYTTGEYAEYVSGAFGADLKMVDLVADLHMSSDTDRMQVYVDLFQLDPSTQVETRLYRTPWPATTPTAIGQTAGTVVNFQFKPHTIGWTWEAGMKLMVRVASNYPAGFAAEPVPAEYTIYHDSDKKSRLIVTFAP